MIDLFGFVDVTIDDWEDCLLYDAGTDSVGGCTVNALMRGVFWLHSGLPEHVQQRHLPGTVAAWRRVASCVYPCLTSLLTPDCLLSRVAFAVRSHVSRTCGGGAACTPAAAAHRDENTSRAFALGALRFLCYFVRDESVYVSDAHVFKLAESAPSVLGSLVEDIGRLCAGDGSSPRQVSEFSELRDVAREVIATVKALTNIRSNQLYSPAESSLGWTGVAYPARVPPLPRQARLRTNLSSVGDKDGERPAADPCDFMRQEATASNTTETGPPIGVFGVSTEIYEDIQEERRLPSFISETTKPMGRTKAVSFCDDLTSDEPMAPPPKRVDPSRQIPIGVFGVSADLWDDIQSGVLDPEDDPPQPALKRSFSNCTAVSNTAMGTQFDINSKIQKIELPKPRVTLPTLYDVVKMNSVPSAEESILDVVDMLELARQWTLVDAALFQAIPLSSYQICELECKNQHLQRQGAQRSHAPGTAEWTLPRASGSVPELRMFIDRFNAQSSWATTVVLQEASPRGRATVYERLVHLATCLYELHNFNGCMAIAAGLMQGSVTRLGETLSMTSLDVEEKMAQLKELMSGSKNYAHYRAEVNKTETLATGIDSCLHDCDFRIGDDGSFIEIYSTKLKSARGSIDFEHVACAVEFGATGIVPHLGPVLSELVQTQEGSSVYLLDHPHLLNFDRLVVYAQTLSRLRALSGVHYWPLTPIPPIMTAVGIAVNKEMLLIPHLVADRSRNLYNLSLARECGDTSHTATPSGGNGDSSPSRCTPTKASSSVVASPDIDTPLGGAASEKNDNQTTPPIIPSTQDSPAEGVGSQSSPSSVGTNSSKKSKWYSPPSLFGNSFLRKPKNSSPNLSPNSPRRGSSTCYNTNENEAAPELPKVLNSNPDMINIFGREVDPFLEGGVSAGRNNGGDIKGQDHRGGSRVEAEAYYSNEFPGGGHLDGFHQTNTPRSRLFINGEVSDDVGGHSLPISAHDSMTHDAEAVSPETRVAVSLLQKSPSLRTVHSKNYSDWLEKRGKGPLENVGPNSPESSSDHSQSFRESPNSPNRFGPSIESRSERPTVDQNLLGSPPPFVFPKQSHYNGADGRGAAGTKNNRLLQQYNNYQQTQQNLLSSNRGIRLLPEQSMEPSSTSKHLSTPFQQARENIRVNNITRVPTDNRHAKLKATPYSRGPPSSSARSTTPSLYEAEHTGRYVADVISPHTRVPPPRKQAQRELYDVL